MLVAVTIRGNDFPDHPHQRKLLVTTDATGEICDTAKRLFVELQDGRTPLRLLGVSLTDLTHREEAQMSLFEDDHKRSRKLDKAMDPIWDIFGRGYHHARWGHGIWEKSGTQAQGPDRDEKRE